MSRTLFSLAGFQVILIGRFWVIPEAIASKLRNKRRNLVLVLQSVKSKHYVTKSEQTKHAHPFKTSFVNRSGG